jgi:hypothetical protein
LPVAVVFLLRAVVLVLLWGFVVAAVIAVRHDVFGTGPAKQKNRPGRTASSTARPSAPAPPPKSSRKPSQSGASHVAVIEGPAAGTTVALASSPVTIGRAPTSGVVLPDDYVSSNHARLVPQGQDWVLEDTGSTNGTFVNDRKVNSPVVVPVGGRIKIGRNVLELRA